MSLSRTLSLVCHEKYRIKTIRSPRELWLHETFQHISRKMLTLHMSPRNCCTECCSNPPTHTERIKNAGILNFPLFFSFAERRGRVSEAPPRCRRELLRRRGVCLPVAGISSSLLRYRQQPLHASLPPPPQKKPSSEFLKPFYVNYTLLKIIRNHLHELPHFIRFLRFAYICHRRNKLFI